jgi:hypothetical protein
MNPGIHQRTIPITWLMLVLSMLLVMDNPAEAAIPTSIRMIGQPVAVVPTQEGTVTLAAHDSCRGSGSVLLGILPLSHPVKPVRVHPFCTQGQCWLL